MLLQSVTHISLHSSTDIALNAIEYVRANFRAYGTCTDMWRRTLYCSSKLLDIINGCFLISQTTTPRLLQKGETQSKDRDTLINEHERRTSESRVGIPIARTHTRDSKIQ